MFNNLKALFAGWPGQQRGLNDYRKLARDYAVATHNRDPETGHMKSIIDEIHNQLRVLPEGAIRLIRRLLDVQKVKAAAATPEVAAPPPKYADYRTSRLADTILLVLGIKHQLAKYTLVRQLNSTQPMIIQGMERLADILSAQLRAASTVSPEKRVIDFLVGYGGLPSSQAQRAELRTELRRTASIHRALSRILATVKIENQVATFSETGNVNSELNLSDVATITQEEFDLLSAVVFDSADLPILLEDRLAENAEVLIELGKCRRVWFIPIDELPDAEQLLDEGYFGPTDDDDEEDPVASRWIDIADGDLATDEEVAQYAKARRAWIAHELGEDGKGVLGQTMALSEVLIAVASPVGDRQIISAWKPEGPELVGLYLDEAAYWAGKNGDVIVKSDEIGDDGEVLVKRTAKATFRTDDDSNGYAMSKSPSTGE